MHNGIERYGSEGTHHQTISGQQDEWRKLKAQLRRVAEERNILKGAAVGSSCHCKRVKERYALKKPVSQRAKEDKRRLGINKEKLDIKWD
ncbi:MAG: hypothetical protein ACJAUP_001990 [Cellvibrionaceae bacterium]|jgi:hypothetical protein